MNRITTILTILILLTGMSCVEPFDPPEVASPEQILVVEGTLDAPSGNARVVLSVIRNIASPTADSLASRVSNANVVVRMNNSEFGLIESETGVYTGLLPVDMDAPYTLVVEALGETYESEAVKIPPAVSIDSLTFSADGDGITMEVTTHDPSNNSRYYQWVIEETIKYRTQHYSAYYYTGNEVEQRREFIFYCWKTIPSSGIFIATTDGLAEDLVYKQPLNFIPADSWKKEIEYSLLVKQYVITKETFIFLSELENNTENLGTLFDPQPGRIEGNIRAVTNEGEYVIGMFSARNADEERIFIERGDLPDYDPLPPICNPFLVDSLTLNELFRLTQPLDLIAPLTTPMGAIIGYTTASKPCLDCRTLRGGTTTEPDYWE